MPLGSTPSHSAALAAALVVAALAGAAPAGAKTVRVYAMGPKLDLAWMESREAYRAKMLALADKTLRGPESPPIQDGADDFASHLLGPADPSRPVETARDLVLWPEDIGLFAALTGERAEPARNSGSVEGSIATLIGLYAPQSSHYAQRYPELGSRAPQTRLLGLALTDTFGRVAIETFSQMANGYDVYLHAGVNMAQDWHVVCTDREAFNSASPPRLPGAVQCDEESPQKVQQLGDPFEPGRDYVYEATTPRVSNMALVFDPDGKLIAKQVKTYITPIELGPAEGSLGLDLVPGEVSGGLGAVETPVGTLGFVTSKDAWMPDVVQKLDQRHVDLLVQPEYFSNNVVCSSRCPGGAPPGMYAPDTLRASGYNDVLRHPSIETMVLPELTGNIFNLTADAQQHIAVKPRRSGEGAGFLVGQPPGAGLAQVMPWAVPDPTSPGEPFAERRRRLGEAGDRLAPGSGVECPDPAKPGPCENGHVEGVLLRDVEVARAPRYRRFRGRRTRTRFSRSRPVRRSRSPQRNAALALRGRLGVLAYEERRGDVDRVFLVRTRDGGRTWSRPVRPTGRPPGSTDEWWPAVALGGRGRVTVAWVDRSSGVERVHFARSTDGGRSFGPASPLDVSLPVAAQSGFPPLPASDPATVAQWRPALAQGRGEVVHAAYIDERARSQDEDLPQAGLYYARIEGGVAEPPRRLDTGEPAALAAKLDNAWAPSVAARGDRVLVAWLDFQRYDWDVLARVSDDGGETFAEQVPVNDTPEDDPATSANEQEEALDDTPRAALGRTAALVAWTDWRKTDETATRPHQAYDTFIATPGSGRNTQVDPHGRRQVSTFSPAICADGRDDALVAFQDAGRGQNDVRVVRMGGGTRRGRAHRIDDAGGRGGNAWRPQLGCWGRRVVAAWEDERDGPPQIYTAVAARRRLR